MFQARWSLTWTAVPTLHIMHHLPQTPVTGSSFAFNADYTKLTIKGDANILGSMDGGGNNKVFQIKEFTADRLTLFVPDAAWSTGWTWVFKPAV